MIKYKGVIGTVDYEFIKNGDSWYLCRNGGARELSTVVPLLLNRCYLECGEDEIVYDWIERVFSIPENHMQEIINIFTKE